MTTVLELKNVMSLLLQKVRSSHPVTLEHYDMNTKSEEKKKFSQQICMIIK